jgi:hypothetical protein
MGLAPMTLREEVFNADGGRCVGCGAVQSPSADQWQWQCHHALKKPWMVRFGADRGDPNLAVLLCRRCHERHENRTAPVPLDALPLRVRSAVADLGDAADDLLRRYHPPTELDAA